MKVRELDRAVLASDRLGQYVRGQRGRIYAVKNSIFVARADALAHNDDELVDALSRVLGALEDADRILVHRHD